MRHFPGDGKISGQGSQDLSCYTATKLVIFQWESRYKSGYGGGLSILRDLEIQSLDHSEVLTVLGHQREPLFDGDGRNQRIKDV